ncbi:glycosyltransferase [Hymenobacter sp. 15J16-1T3B]|uniref:glycosyltransferase family 2 protein n=1 Tax=Hymenobacter sp. 15J16-1T3B TaxID=2886941 RepID=UPI001D10D380|nr:glycosyltransferase family 2 protein [Hymenobacter sp. 15J16-1T3B]MCC3158536.1 glycosyltransferase [Hymenobacter sp. 15J16-1T3B]
MGASTPSVLLSIVSWNSAATIEACLRSVLRQSYRDFVVWVVDNASADDTCARVAALAAEDARVRLHRLPQNTGFCGGHNYALDRTRTDYVLLVNPDVDMAPDYLARALSAMQRDARIGAVCGLLVQSHDADPRIDSAGLLPLAGGRYGLRHHNELLSQANVQPGWVAGADGALPLYRRRFINDLRVEGQFFDERFFAHKEDWDVAWRGELYGWRTWLEPSCRAVHPRVFRPGNWALRQRLNGAIKADAVKNQLLLLIKNAPAGRALRTWLRALPRQLAILLFLVLREPRSLTAYRYVWRHRRALWASRQRVQTRAHQGWPPPPEQPLPTPPLLSICVPCYHRPELLSRALASIGPLPAEVEVIVSDNSVADDACEEAAHRLLVPQPAAQWRYYRNPAGSTAVDNFRLCLQRARGRYVLHLHDDDYLLPNGLEQMLSTLRRVQLTHAAVLFGVEVVDMQQQRLRYQRARQESYLPPAEAVEQLLTNSSFVRIPAIVVSRAAYAEAGGLDESQGSTADTDLWARVFARHGVLRVPACTAAYTVHTGAITARMFTPATVDNLLRIFEKVRATGLLPEPRLRRARAHFFHQFILAGAYRSLQQHDADAARQVLQLFELPALRPLAVPARWAPARLGLTALLRGTPRLPGSGTSAPPTAARSASSTATPATAH